MNSVFHQQPTPEQLLLAVLQNEEYEHHYKLSTLYEYVRSRGDLLPTSSIISYFEKLGRKDIAEQIKELIKNYHKELIGIPSSNCDCTSKCEKTVDTCISCSRPPPTSRPAPVTKTIGKKREQSKVLRKNSSAAGQRGGASCTFPPLPLLPLPPPTEFTNNTLDTLTTGNTFYVFCHGELNFHCGNNKWQDWVTTTDWVKDCNKTDYFYQPTDFADYAADFINMGEESLTIMTGALGAEQLSEGNDNKILSMTSDLLCRTGSECLNDVLVKSNDEADLSLNYQQHRFVKAFYCPPNNMGVNKECKFGDNCTCDSFGRHNNKTCGSHTKETWRMGVFCDKGEGAFDISELKENPKKLVTECGKWPNRSLRGKCERIWNWVKVQEAIKEAIKSIVPNFDLVDYITGHYGDKIFAVIGDDRKESLYPGSSTQLKDCPTQPENRMKEKERLWNILYNWVNHPSTTIDGETKKEELLQNIRFCKLFYLRLIQKPAKSVDDPDLRHTDPNIYLNTKAEAEDKTLKFDVEGIFGRELMEIYGPGTYVYVNCSPLRIWEGTEYPLPIENQQYENNFIAYNQYVLSLNNIWKIYIKKFPLSPPLKEKFQYRYAFEEDVEAWLTPAVLASIIAKLPPGLGGGGKKRSRRRKTRRRKKHKKQTRKHGKKRRKRRTKKQALKKKNFSHKI